MFAKVLSLAFLNVCLLALVGALFARLQFRLDAGSFLLAPAENRIMATADALALELDQTPGAAWDGLLTRFSRDHGVTCSLLDEDGRRVAGPDLHAPPEVAARIPRRPNRPDGPPRDRPHPPREERAPDEGGAARGGEPPLFFASTSSPDAYWAGVRIPVRRDPMEEPKPGTLILTSSSLLGTPVFFDARPWLAVMVAVILVSLVCWLPFIRGMTRSIAQLTRAAGQIAEGRFEVQVAHDRRDEIGQLGDAISRMASRLAGFVNGQKRFLGGIAHELCTPIATIQFGLGNLDRRVAEEQRDRVAEIQEEVQHMSALVNELLSFSKAGMAGLDVKVVDVNVAATVARAVEREAASGGRVEIAVDDRLFVLAEPEYLFRAVSNLVRNAIRYAGHAGPIRISAKPGGGLVRLTVADQGPGVPDETLDEIFAPFYRLDPARNQDTGGVGLGLAIVKSCVEACGGVVRCRNRRPSGLEVEIALRAASRPADHGAGRETPAARTQA